MLPTMFTAPQRAYIVAEYGHVFTLESGTMEELIENINENWSNVMVLKGVDCIIKAVDQGVASPRPKQKRIDTLVEVVKNMAWVVFAPFVHALLTVIIIVRALYVFVLGTALYLGYR
eukprot:6547426-Pyramimonas_sp.AAC.1